MKIKSLLIKLIFIYSASTVAQDSLKEIKKIIWEDFLIVNEAYTNKPGFKNLDFNNYFDEAIKINTINYKEIGFEERYFFYKINITFVESYNFKFDNKTFDYYLIKDNNNFFYKYNGFIISDFLIWEKKMSGNFYDAKEFYNFLIDTHFFTINESKEYVKFYKNPLKYKGSIFYSNLFKEIFPKYPKIYKSIVLFPY